MGRARGGNALLDHKGGHEVGRAEVPRLSFEAARPKAEVVANGQAHAYLPTYLPTYQIRWGSGVRETSIFAAKAKIGVHLL